MGTQNSLYRMIMNSRVAYLDGKTIKDISALKPEIGFDELPDFEDINDDYEIIFYDKKAGVLKLEKYDDNKKVLFTLSGLPSDEHPWCGDR